MGQRGKVATLGGKQPFVILAMDRPLQVADAPARGEVLLLIVRARKIAVDAGKQHIMRPRKERFSRRCLENVWEKTIGSNVSIKARLVESISVFFGQKLR